MFARSSFFALRPVAIVWLLFAFAGLWACGRSDLDDYLVGDGGGVMTDSGSDVPDVPDVQASDNAACDATTCPTGCCDSSGQCAPGSDGAACGTLGQACASCLLEGFQFCDPTRHACGNAVASCDPANCSGCCEGNVCFAGIDPNECGLGGQACLHCAGSGLACVGEQCVQPGCGPGTCSGCCFGEECVTGTDQTACGDQGEACDNCVAAGQSCAAQLGSGGTCVNVASCNATSCPGCCDLADTCQPGFIDTLCGQGGASCTDCTQLAPASTCDLGVSPRTCQSQPMQCPAAYVGCPPGLETPAPTKQIVCTSSELQNAAAACEGGAHSTACDSFFAFEKANDPGCAACLGAFDFDFTELTGLAACVAPFTDAACDHVTACVVDCADQSCAQCTDPVALQQCQGQVLVGACAPYLADAQCVAGAFLGAGSFCAPIQGFGDWLSVVGQFYCGPAQ